MRQLQTSSGKTKKLKFKARLSLPKKYLFSGKTVYRVDLSNFPFNYMCENSPDFLCHFWNHKPFFPTHLLCIFLAQTLHTFDKRSPSERKFSDFPLLPLKFTKFLVSFFKQKVSFSSKSRSFFSVMRWLFMLLTKVLHEGANFQTCL